MFKKVALLIITVSFVASNFVMFGCGCARQSKTTTVTNRK